MMQKMQNSRGFSSHEGVRLHAFISTSSLTRVIFLVEMGNGIFLKYCELFSILFRRECSDVHYIQK